tara:strand:- start:60543 stop:63068 length:2526 start_codon:yes stop_codon:yes gene_type:complete
MYNDATSIYGGKLKRHVFKNSFERYQFAKEGGADRVYNNLPIEQNFLIDMFWKRNKSQEFSQFPLSIHYVDIEVYSPDEFPDEWEAKHPINVTTIYNSLKNEFKVMCVGEGFDPDALSEENIERFAKIKEKSKIIVTIHETEKELLLHMLSYWEEDYPDVITGWNLPFDIPYIVNRMKTLLPRDEYLRMSPTGQVREITRKKKLGPQYAIDVQDYLITGVTALDYQDVYMKFNAKPVPNRKLDTIAEIELNKGKVKYESSNLAKLSVDDWDLFVFYNIEDVNVIKLLEEKLCFLKVARLLSYLGMTPLNKALDTLPIVNGYCAVNAYEEGKVIPTFRKDSSDWRKYEGAYVKQPIAGFYEQIVSFDLNSLYPMTMITLNTSPETKFGRVIYNDDGNTVIFQDNTGKSTPLTLENFKKVLKKGNLSVSKSNVIFTQSKRGIFPTMAEEVYNKRLEFKGLMSKNKDAIKAGVTEDEEERLQSENTIYNVFQLAFKIMINSLYGYSGNRYAFMSDIDIAESVTITCQDVIKKSGDFLNQIANTIIGDDDNGDMVIYSDTDSCYFELTKLLDHLNIPFYADEETKDDIHPKVLKICDIITNKLNDLIERWGVTELNSDDCRFKFKMEAISDKGLFIAKKMYVLHVLNDEGYHVKDEGDRWKYKGVKLASAGMPVAIKPLVKDVVHNMVYTGKKSVADDYYIRAYEKFKSLDIDSICLVKSINKFDEYVKGCNDWNTAPRMLAHYRGAYYYNRIIKEQGLTATHSKITRSDKVKYVYVHKNNRYGIDVISYVDDYPKEFESIFQIDVNLMFEKGVKDVMAQFYKAVNWHIVSPNKQARVDVMSFLT